MSQVNAMIQKFLSHVSLEEISEERKTHLQALITFIIDRCKNNQDIRLNFICTHNSRRSHLSQIWAQTCARQYGFYRVQCYSGGTEATAIYPEVLQTLEQTGFHIHQLSAGQNPVYSIKFHVNQLPIIGFSKEYDCDFNPSHDFAAVMTCNQADKGCPYIPGAQKRIPLTYEDPKIYDNTSVQAAKYAERSLQIATEMRYVFETCKNVMDKL